MTPERWRQVNELFTAVVELGPEERRAFLSQSCAGDHRLRVEVESLLASDSRGWNVLETPAVEMAAPLLANDQPQLIPGQTFSHYEILGLLGKGGMGEVYLAADKLLNRKIALKLLPADCTRDKVRLRQFQQEAQATSALNHPNILTIHEIGQAEDQRFIATEFVDGETLRQRLKRGPLTLCEAWDIAIQLAGALSAAHEAGIVHRDIKPENIMLRRDGYVKVLDFGLVKLTEQQEVTIQSQSVDDVNLSSWFLMGTVKYMSPEQARGKQVDARSDIFSFGVVLYEMLTSQNPFADETISNVLHAIIERDPPPIATFTPDVTPDLQRVTDRTLCKDASARYQTVAELMADLKALRPQLETQTDSVPNRESHLIANGAGAVATAKRSPALLESLKERKYIATLFVVGVALLVPLLTRAWLKANHTNRNANVVNSLAVLPFKLIDEEDRDHLGVGMADTLITRLGVFKQINVRPINAILKYKEQDADPASVGREQQVDAVLHGRIRKIGERWKVAVQLTDARDGSLLWNAEFDEDSTRLYEVEIPIARGLATALNVNLAENEKQRFVKHYTENPEAHRLYLEGRHYWNKRDQEACRKAIIRFQEATDIDPSYALAWTGLADTYSFLGSAYFDPLPPRDDMEKSKAAATRALELDDTLAEAHHAMAFIKGWYELDWKGAEEGLKRALELNPNYASAHQTYAWWFLAMGRMDEALAEMKRAQLSDPLSPPINSNIGAFLYFAHRYDESLAQFQLMFTRDPIFSWNHSWIGLVYLEKGDFDNAIKEFKYEKLPYEQGRWGLAVAYAKTGKTVEARKILDQFYKLARERYVSPTAFILIHLALGEKQKAFEWLEKAYEARDFDLCEIKVNPQLEPLRTDPRYKSLVQRVGLN